MKNKINTKPYQRKGYLNNKGKPTKAEYRKTTHDDRLKKWKEKVNKK